METHEDILRLLLENLNNARMAHEIAKNELAKNSYGLRETNSGEVEMSTMQAWIKALFEFSAFVLHQTVPDRFRDGRRIQPDSLASATTSLNESHQDCWGNPKVIRFPATLSRGNEEHNDGNPSTGVQPKKSATNQPEPIGNRL
jgi:hypothetical protein